MSARGSGHEDRDNAALCLSLRLPLLDAHIGRVHDAGHLLALSQAHSPARPMKRRDPVTPGMALAVFLRDGDCVAPRLDPDAGPCSGRITIEHVKRQSRLGRRAESVMECLVSLCEGHTEPGMKAGHVWNLSHKAELRDYLAAVSG